MPPDCIYCGWVANSVDHYRPLDASRAERRAVTRRNTAALTSGILRPGTVFACLECNSALSAYGVANLDRRAEYLAAKYEGRYVALLATADWTANELKNLELPMREHVIESMVLRDKLRQRLHTLHKPGRRAD